ncbi:MAG TPA: hypothetical protein VGB74_12770, partial [Actinoplanes sp.]
MSQNGPHSGPPWSGGGSEEPYAEPADPWGDHSASAPIWGGQEAPPWGLSSPTPEPAWGGHPPSIPQQPVSYHSGLDSAPISDTGPGWSQPPPPRKRNIPMLALVVSLGLLICVGLGTTLWLLNKRTDAPATKAAPATSAAANPAPAVVGSEDARFNVKKGDCVVNEGTDEVPEMRTTACT